MRSIVVRAALGLLVSSGIAFADEDGNALDDASRRASRRGPGGGPRQRRPRAGAARGPEREEWAGGWGVPARGRGMLGAPPRGSAGPSEPGRGRPGDARGSAVAPRRLRLGQ